MLGTLAITCVLAISTLQGQICIKPDGNVLLPEGLAIELASRQFWEELAKTYSIIKQEKCL